MRNKPSSTSWLIVGLGAAWLGFVGPLSATELAAPAAEEIQRWIGELASPSYNQREKATRCLAGVGVPAKEALLKALRHRDPEVRARVQRILSQVLEQDFQIRLRAFAISEAPEEGYGLPGWDRFSSMLGNDRAARQLFVEMQRAEGTLVELAETEPRQLSEALTNRLRLLEENEDDEEEETRRDRFSVIGRTVAVLFSATHPQLKINDEVATYVNSLLYDEHVQEAMGSGTVAERLKMLLGQWVRRELPPGSSQRSANLMLAIQHELPETRELALGMVEDTSVESYLRPYVILAAARFGGKAAIPRLLPALKDQGVCNEWEQDDGDTLECRVGDVALAALVQLTGQALPEYGLSHLEGESLMEMEFSQIGFPDEMSRRKAVEKFQAWLAEHPVAKP